MSRRALRFGAFQYVSLPFASARYGTFGQNRAKALDADTLRNARTPGELRSLRQPGYRPTSWVWKRDTADSNRFFLRSLASLSQCRANSL
jgi:hypothetical protein